jgi:hypothetical protein
MLFNNDLEIYNYRLSKNTAEIEERLNRMLEVIKGVRPDEVAQIKRPNFTSYYFVHMINVFGKIGGFEKLVLMIEDSTKR